MRWPVDANCRPPNGMGMLQLSSSILLSAHFFDRWTESLVRWGNIMSFNLIIISESKLQIMWGWLNCHRLHNLLPNRNSNWERNIFTFVRVQAILANLNYLRTNWHHLTILQFCYHHIICTAWMLIKMTKPT